MVSKRVRDPTTRKMVQSSSSQVRDSVQEDLDDGNSVPASLKFLISNIKNIVPTQLSSDNYAIWRSRVLKLLRANGFSLFLEATAEPPSRLMQTPDGLTVTNPKYNQWLLIDQNLATTLCSTIAPSILPYVLHLESCSAIWSTVEQRLQATNRSCVIQLKNELHNISMKNLAMVQYLIEIKNSVNKISAAGSNIDAEDIILYTLNGLPPTYNAFKTYIRTMLNPISLEDLYSLLISEEINIQAESSRNNNLPNPNLALYSYRGSGRRGRANSNTSKALVATMEENNLDWYLDSGASSHLMNDLNKLNNPASYQGSDNVQVGNGNSLSIAHTVNGILPTPSQNLRILLLPPRVGREPGSDANDRLPRATKEPRQKLEEDNGNLAWSNHF
ncbi:hypothetical protein M5K25_000062 [Dendrobium thyrsiflorum]|uniref:Retrovirus-related Pol polyprotein from transposon TNT 1-94 n=1 Tax=Dendrobium thyrsiflorum TaxID=117978 RepID=A0ABD0W632_DENTH